ncbi:hypothetical protein Back2_12840 [Nocardioides baekrokdamisoli]|uniref:Integral membrane protein n=1 Tax=Nocardioides baekrokdamisoli TaxID=1804624 RepID=A0A3G9IDG7_9ACTN|nr:DMT family transporter [Nocardioides baekrokdamisoli]BBH16997.1 hypothetical protein Back2_12840 [Nocardioides baekrokdamisoli]
MFIAAVAVTVAACFLFALSAWLTQHAGAGHPERSGGLKGIGRLILSLVKQPMWMIGAVAGVVGFWLQAVALHWTGLSVVQPMMPAQLLFAVLLASMSARRWPLVRDLAATVAVCGGVSLLVIKAQPPAENASPNHVTSLVVGIVVVMAALLFAAHHRKPAIAAAITATAAGTGFALTAVFLKLVADRFAAGEYASLLTYVPTYGLLVSMIISAALTQAALAAGPLPWSMAGMTIAEPVAGVAAAWVAFGSKPPGLLFSATAAVLLIVGVGGLLSSPAAALWVPDSGVGDELLPDGGVELEHLRDGTGPRELFGPGAGGSPSL